MSILLSVPMSASPRSRSRFPGFIQAVSVLIVAQALLSTTSVAQNFIPGEWDDRFYLSPGCDGQIRASAQSADGRIFLGGEFSACDGVVVNNLAIYNPVTQVYSAVIDQGLVGVNGEVNALAFDGTGLFVAGYFDQAGALSVNNIARLGPGGWSRLGSPADNGVTRTDTLTAGVLDLALSGTRLYVGGFFETAGAEPANNIAYWESGQWSSVGVGAENGVSRAEPEFGSNVWAMLPLGDQLVVGGTFDRAGTVVANRIALWDGSNWASFGSDPDNGFSFGSVRALATLGLDLVVGGSFRRNLGGIDAENLLRWDGSDWQTLGPETGIDGTVISMVVDDGDLYIGGRFEEVDGIEVNNIARWDGLDWHTVGALSGSGVGGSSNTVGGFARVESLELVGGGVLAGGDFSTADGLKAMGIALFRDATTLALGQDDGLGLSGPVNAIAIYQDDIFVGGTFEYAGPIRTNNIARFDGEAWHALEDRGFIGILESETFDGVNALATYQGKLYVGGEFSNVADLGIDNLIAWDGSAWGPLPLIPNGVIQALTTHEGALIAGGSFTTLSDDAEANYIAAFDGSSWTPLANFLGNGVNSTVLSLASGTNGLYMGGFFSSAGDSPADGLALWDGAAFSSPAGGPGGITRTILPEDGSLLVGSSNFNPAVGSASQVLSVFSNGSWEDPTGLASGTANDLLRSEFGLIVAGGFTTQDEVVLGVGVYDDNDDWLGLGAPRLPEIYSLGSSATTLLRVGDTLLVGGRRKAYSGVPVAGFSIFDFNPKVEDAIFTDRFEEPLR